MRIALDNVNLASRSGPNGFAKKLMVSMPDEHTVAYGLSDPDVQLSFISIARDKGTPICLRLDGIYFNSEQNWQAMNAPIKASYDRADAVIFQSEFNLTLSEKYFGKHKNAHVIHNGSLTKQLDNHPILSHKDLDQYDDIWCCASSWRPHKRLSENIKYFLRHSLENDCLVIAGANPDVDVDSLPDNVFYAGDLTQDLLWSLFRASKYFIHLAWLDHCPNVVVDARAAGCHIVCSSAGGTKEVAGLNSTIIEEDEWDFSPLALYKPPTMDFSKKISNTRESIIGMDEVANAYLDVLRKLV